MRILFYQKSWTGIMKKQSLFIYLLLTAATALSFIESSPGKDFRQLYPLQGKWLMKTKKGFIGEEWVRIGKYNLQNIAYTIKGKDTTITERVTLKKSKRDIFYTSTVEEQNKKMPVGFRLVSLNDHTFVFENREHDFPKRITYKLVNNDSIHAWIDDGMENSKKASHFYYSRVHN